MTLNEIQIARVELIACGYKFDQLNEMTEEQIMNAHKKEMKKLEKKFGRKISELNK
jgi:hypothetical protein